MNDIDLDELYNELNEGSSQPEVQEGLSHREKRIIAGFADIVRFVETQQRLPQADDAADIFERLYAVRLQTIRQSEECRTLLRAQDMHNLLGDIWTSEKSADEIDDEQLLADLQELSPETDIGKLTHVRSYQERDIVAPDYVARCKPCADFATFAPLFTEMKEKIESGLMESEAFSGGDIEVGDFFVLGGQLAYVAAIGEKSKNKNGTFNARLRVIFDNQTESDLINRSLGRALYRDHAGRRIVPARNNGAQPALFGEELEADDSVSGTIYVLRSLSNHPFIKKHRNLVHKIGVTGNKVESRLGNAGQDPTFLCADVEIVAQYKLANINRGRLENILHRFFAEVRLDISIPDRFGNQVRPQEWFLVPLAIIDETVKAIGNGMIQDLRYDAKQAKLVSVKYSGVPEKPDRQPME